ncbi:ribonuclease Z [Candidatus Woesearchaeota archaeon]|nr:ribonuclease Z [Candidatus Woesearchaeota archaeon]
MEVVFLGTSSMVPTKDRNQSGVFVSYGSEGILLDCGEGIQRQLKIAGISLTKLTKILITHWHGDHVLGLPGVVQTLGSLGYTGRLRVYGPKGTAQRFELMKKAFVFEENIEMEVTDIGKRVFFEGSGFSLEALPLEHTTECLGFAIVENDKRKIQMDAVRKLGLPEGPLVGELQEGKSVKWKGRQISPDEVSYVSKGRKLAYITDTALCNNAVELARDADMLICEATYAEDLEEKAEAYRHLTSRQAGLIANRANAKKLVLTHFSQRYKTTHDVEEGAKTVFDNIICAKDFMRMRV